MAKISYEEAQSSANSNNTGVGFFSLADDGDEAVVRILHDSTDSFDIVTIHDIQAGDKRRKIDCLRTLRDPLDKCPFCNAGMKTSQRFYIHLLEYQKDENGNIVVLPRIWERSTQYATTIKNLMDEYGPLSDCVFKIRRNGAKGDLHTTYSIMFGNPNVYKEEFYPKDTSAFEDFSVVGSVVSSKTEDEMKYYLVNGSFEDNTDPSAQDNSTNSANTAPWQSPNTVSTVSRPQRFY